ncbi:calpain-5-like [Littorina saxatilis]|uniref:calpain-5-like n=1 Tax=Littorina saxatilis TaxID=31220 RepID=UPI0038B424FC
MRFDDFAKMRFEDFAKYFTHIDICHFVNTSFFSTKKSWSEAVWHSQWTVSGRNGGGNYESATFLSNPQYMFDVMGLEDRIMVSLEQHDVKGREAMLGQMNTIGFHIMRVEDNRKYRVHIPGEKVFTSDYADFRSIFGTVKLRKGRYVILPTTKDAGSTGQFMVRLYTGSSAGASNTGQFMVRLYTGSSAGARELKDEAPTVGCPCLPKYRCVTTIRIEKCEDLAPPPGHKGSFDPFVILRCEGEKVQSGYVSDSRCPVFDVAATFYRKKPDSPIVIEVWNHNRVLDDYVAEARCEEKGTEVGEQKVLVLYGRKKEAAIVMPGKMSVYVRTSNDLTLL